MRKWPLLLITLVFALLQAGFPDSLRLFNIKPDLILISVVIASMYLDFRAALGISVFGGILKDAFSISTLGINTALFPIWCFTIRKLSKEVSLDDDYLHPVFVFVAVILNDVAARMVSMFLGSFLSWGIFLRVTFLESLYTALITYLIFRFIKPLKFIT
jgi:rod shape-determining protein MreD